MLGPLLTEHDLYLLAEGTFQRPYERLGAHPIVLDGTPGTRFAWSHSTIRGEMVRPSSTRCSTAS